MSTILSLMIILLCAGAGSWLAYGAWRINAVSTGEPVKTRPGAALLLVDLQSVFWDAGPYSEQEKSDAQSVILSEINTANKNGDPVIALRQEWSIPSTKAIARLVMNGQAIQGSEGTEIAKPFSDHANHVLIKRVQDGFETGQLDKLLEKLGVGQLRIAGLDFNCCIAKTALAGRNRGYGVTIVKGGTLSSAPTKQTERRLAAAQVEFQ